MIWVSRIFVLILFFIPAAFSMLGAFLGSPSSSGTGALADLFSNYTMGAAVLTLKVGWVSTALAILLTGMALGWFRLAKSRSQHSWWTTGALGTLISIPHLSLATGLLLLVGDSGWLVRVLGSLFPGREYAFQLDHDVGAWTLSLFLGMKESLFLIYVGLPLVDSVGASRKIVNSLGRSNWTSWWWVEWPQVLHGLRYAIWAVLGYSICVVDVAVVLGPTNPPVFALVLWDWIKDPGESTQALVSGGALMLLALVALGVFGWEGALWSLGRFKSWLLSKGKIGKRPLPLSPMLLFILFTLILSVVALVLWVFGDSWTIDQPIPPAWTLEFAREGVSSMRGTLIQTLGLAVSSALASIATVLLWIEFDSRAHTKIATTAVFLMLVFPALIAVIGLDSMLSRVGIYHPSIAVFLGHMLFVFPYVFLVLQQAFHQVDPRLALVAASLGKSKTVFLLKIRVPLLKGSIAAAFAVGFAVSVSQFLPTIMLGGGDWTTLATETVASLSSGNRRWVAVYGLANAMLPAAVFLFCSLFSQRPEGSTCR